MKAFGTTSDPRCGYRRHHPTSAAAAAAAAAAAGGMEAGGTEAGMEADEVWENQRWYGMAWKAPLSLLDRPEWTDGSGAAPAGVLRLPCEDHAGWQLVTGAGTDAEGWQYGTVFRHLEYKRAGGRASQRLGDTVRRRLWRRARRVMA